MAKMRKAEDILDELENNDSISLLWVIKEGQRSALRAVLDQYEGEVVYVEDILEILRGLDE